MAHCEQEEQEKLKPGTHKAAVFQVLKAAGAEGLTVQESLAAGRDAGLKDWDEGSRRTISFVSPSTPQLGVQQAPFSKLEC